MRSARLCAALAFLLWLLLAAGPANAQFALLFGGGGNIISERDLAFETSGTLEVRFSGDAAAGCARHGLCGYSGAVTWSPGQRGFLTLLGYRRHHRVGYDALIIFGEDDPGSVTYARVRSPGGGTCEDAQTSQFVPDSLPVRGGSVLISARRQALLTTRCAGPLVADIGRALVQRAVSIKALEHRGRTISLTGTLPFADHGFSGTVISTLVLHLRKPQRPSTGSGNPPTSTRYHRVRYVNVKLGSARVHGRMVAGIRGSSNPDLCALLDTCGIRGTLAFGSPSPAGTGELEAWGPAKLPYRDFLYALGLARHGSAKGISTFGELGFPPWPVHEQFVQGSDVCSDSSPGRLGGVLSFSRRTVKLGVGPALGSGSTPRTRCPGPTAQGAPSWIASAPLRDALGGRTATFDLRPARSRTDDGWLIKPTGKLTLTLRTRKISSQIEREPVG